MLIGNILLAIQVVILLAIAGGIGHFLHAKYKANQEANWIKEGKAIIEKLPKGLHEGFGYVKEGQILLKKNGTPYLFKTFQEAVKYREKFSIKTKIVYQNWDMESKLVFVGKVNNGPKE